MITETKNAYRVGFRSLRTKEFKEMAFLTDNFLLIVTKQLNPTTTFTISGKEYSHSELYVVPAKEKNIHVKVATKQFDKDNYLELFVFTKEEDLIKRMDEGVLKSSPILALICLCLGERSLDYKMVEDGQAVTLTYEKSEIRKKEKKPIMKYKCAPGVVSPEFRSEEAVPIVDLFPKGFDPLEETNHKYVNLEKSFKNKMNIALRWFYKGISENVIEDRYLAFWIAFEIISMEGSTNVGKAKRFLGKMIGLSIDKIDKHLEIGKLSGIRSDLVHGNYVDQQLLRKYGGKLQNIVEESLRYSLKTRLKGTLSRYL